MFQLEKLAKDGIVYCYARNDHLEFNIPYEFYGVPHVYEPDFLVKLTTGVTVILEVKGQMRVDSDAKHQAARRWVEAVNHWGKLGWWDFLVCWEPQQLPQSLQGLNTTRKQRLSKVAADLLQKAEQEVNRLRKLGWTQADFAKALRQMLENEELN